MNWKGKIFKQFFPPASAIERTMNMVERACAPEKFPLFRWIFFLWIEKEGKCGKFEIFNDRGSVTVDVTQTMAGRSSIYFLEHIFHLHSELNWWIHFSNLAEKKEEKTFSHLILVCYR